MGVTLTTVSKFKCIKGLGESWEWVKLSGYGMHDGGERARSKTRTGMFYWEAPDFQVYKWKFGPGQVCGERQLFDCGKLQLVLVQT